MIPSYHEQIALQHFDAQHPAPACLDIGSGIAPIMNRANRQNFCLCFSKSQQPSVARSSGDNFRVHEIRPGIFSIASMTWTMNLKNPLFFSFVR
jgi:hypothetical protein